MSKAVLVHQDAFYFQADVQEKDKTFFSDINKTLINEESLRVDCEHPLAIMTVDILEGSLYPDEVTLEVNQDRFASAL